MAMDYVNNTFKCFLKSEDRFDDQDRLRREREAFERARREEQRRIDASYGLMFMAPRGPGFWSPCDLLQKPLVEHDHG